MKKLFIPVLLLCLIITLSGCGNKQASEPIEPETNRTSVEEIQKTEVEDVEDVEEPVAQVQTEDNTNSQ